MSLENGEWSSDRVLLKDLCDLHLCVAFGTFCLTLTKLKQIQVPKDAYCPVLIFLKSNEIRKH